MEGPGSEGLVALSRAECLTLLATRYVARVGLVVEGRVEVLPVNYVLAGEAVLVRVADGSTLARSVPGHEVVVEVDRVEDPIAHEGWSVVVRGVGERVTDGGTAGARLRPWAAGPRDAWLRIEASEVSGRRIEHHGGPPPP